MAETAQRYFGGTYTHTIDNQNRVTVPSIWRGPKSSGAQEFFIVPHPDKALWVLPVSEMAKIHERLASASIADRDKWNFVRIFSGRMQQCVLDAQGRLTIGDDLLKYGELERGKDAVLVGLFTHFEIVKPDRWAEWQQRAELNYSDIASRAGF